MGSSGLRDAGGIADVVNAIPSIEFIHAVGRVVAQTNVVMAQTCVARRDRCRERAISVLNEAS